MGERRRGREVIRVVDDDADGHEHGLERGFGSSASGSVSQIRNRPATGEAQAQATGPFKLFLQDHKGAHVYAFTTSETCNAHPNSMQKIALPPRMQIGCKIMLLPGTRICRGMVWIEGDTCVVLGGRIESLDREWREGWEERVKGEVEGMREELNGERGGGGA
ncbi:e421145c-36fd-4f35-979b-d5d87f2e0bb2-CDS [Sclerotinia trifoliorum]|uniref:E421145c-36fd-4f35-979b-d5d87f2e0bb2-CDS n=1 Tax=Sclerotinia trifoliorum TaxID=28548 RepID=A0A8H2ZY83_9HELO|nr:e421145c-36fd-4f35-979b-d5d87f2e0bb2-CDS [Sclerotinia trifoliorum]